MVGKLAHMVYVWHQLKDYVDFGYAAAGLVFEAHKLARFSRWSPELLQSIILRTSKLRKLGSLVLAVQLADLLLGGGHN